MTDEKHWERAYARLLDASNKKIAELEEKLKERDSVRLWNENEELKKKLKIATNALMLAVDTTSHYEDDCKVPTLYEPCNHCWFKEALEKIK